MTTVGFEALAYGRGFMILEILSGLKIVNG